MGRAFEYRKARKLKRWGNMARVFTKLGREIEVAVRDGGADPDFNPKLRVLIQNAKDANMPKDNIENAIKRATTKNTKGYEEVVFEGYGPHGVAIVVETATDNNTRTVANVRSYFNKCGGSLGTTGSLNYLFNHVCIFQFQVSDDMNLDEFELEIIDFGVEELLEDDEGQIQIEAPFESYGAIQSFLEKKNIEIKRGNLARIPITSKAVTPEQREELDKLIELFENDDDVTNVFTNMQEEESDE